MASGVHGGDQTMATCTRTTPIAGAGPRSTLVNLRPQRAMGCSSHRHNDCLSGQHLDAVDQPQIDNVLVSLGE